MDEVKNTGRLIFDEERAWIKILHRRESKTNKKAQTSGRYYLYLASSLAQELIQGQPHSEPFPTFEIISKFF